MPNHVQYAAAHGPVPVAVFRTPFPAGAADGATIAAMQRRNPGPPITFTSAASKCAGTPYRVVVAFGEPAVTGCGVPADAALRMPSGRTEVSAAFCVGNRVVSEANVSGPPMHGPDDPGLARLMQDLLSALMPATDPSFQNSSGSGGGSM